MVHVTFEALHTLGGGPVRARLLSSNLDAWNTRWSHLELATASIDASYFIFEKDPFGYAYLGHLLKKQLDGVKVRVMTDAMADTFGVNGFKMPLRGKDYLQELVNHGGEAFIYHPLWQRPAAALEFDFSVLASNHDKIQVVDGRLSITGGRNIADDYFADPLDLKDAWRDIDVAMEGAGTARALTNAFAAEIAGDHIHRVRADRFGNWVPRDIELVGAYVMMDLWLKDPPLAETEKAALRDGSDLRQTMAEALVERTIARLAADLPEALRRVPEKRELAFLSDNALALVAHPEARGSATALLSLRSPERDGVARILDQTSVAGTRVNDFARRITMLIDAATRDVVLENPYVVLTEEMVLAMEAAAGRGVCIDIITNSPLSTDSTVTQAFFLEDWAYMLARIPTLRIHVITGSRKFHSKAAVIDSRICLITTYNLDLLSGYVNGEVGAAVESPELAADLLAAFRADQADPEHAVLEYRIVRNDDGTPVLKDGLPVPLFGPEHHLPQDVLDDYCRLRKLWSQILRNNLPYLAPLRHPPVTGI
jgi:putative cardiolipin synthase